MEDRTIPRQKVRVAVSLSDGRTMQGEIQIDLDSRLSDFLNEPAMFIVLMDSGGTKLLNKRHIVDIRIF